MHVTVKNFQAISHSTFEVAGFTALVGRSNIGKSAVVRALKCALTGASGTDFVRHDPAKCSRVLKGNKKCKCFSTVEIEFDDGLRVIWKKGDDVNQYDVTLPGKETKVYSKVGSGEVPPELTGVELVQVGDSKELVQVSDQFSPIFLLDQSGTTIADTLSDVAQLDDINQAMRLAVKDRKAASATRKVREKDTLALEASLNTYAGLDNTAQAVEGVQETYETLTEIEARLGRASEFLEKARVSSTAIKSLKLALTGKLPPSRPLTIKSLLLGNVVGWSTSAFSLKGAIRSLEAVMGVPLPSAPLAGKLSELEKVSRFVKELRAKGPVVKGLRGVGGISIPGLDTIRSKVSALAGVSDKLTKLRALKTDLNRYKGADCLSLRSPEEVLVSLESYNQVMLLRAKYERLAKAISDLEVELTQAEKEEAQAWEAFEDLGVCPTCSQHIQPNHSLCKAG